MWSSYRSTFFWQKSLNTSHQEWYSWLKTLRFYFTLIEKSLKSSLKAHSISILIFILIEINYTQTIWLNYMSKRSVFIFLSLQQRIRYKENKLKNSKVRGVKDLEKLITAFLTYSLQLLGFHFLSVNKTPSLYFSLVCMCFLLLLLLYLVRVFW